MMGGLFIKIGLIVWIGAFARLLFLFLSTPDNSPYFEPYEIDAPVGQLPKQDFDTGAAVFLDARPAPFYAMGHIPDALNLSEQAATAHLRQVLSPYSKDTKIIAYCTGDQCQSSGALAQRLLKISPAAPQKRGLPRSVYPQRRVAGLEMRWISH